MKRMNRKFLAALLACLTAGLLAALLYYGAVCLVVERVRTMPEGPPPACALCAGTP